MDIRFMGHNLSVTEGMKEHMRGKLEKFIRYAPRLVESHVVLKKEKYRFEAEVTLLAKNLRAYGEGMSKENIYTAIDQACTRVEKQLKKFREKVKDHKSYKRTVTTASETPKGKANLASPGFRKPFIVDSDAFAPKPMSVEEASLQLELSEDGFLVFLNSESRVVNVIAKREDGDHELIAPRFN